MKRTGVLLSLMIVIAMTVCPAAYAAGGLEIIGISPDEGQQNLQPANVAIKIAFSGDITAADTQALNDGKVTITNAEGEEQPYLMLYNAKKYPNEIWVHIREDLVADTDYKVVISGDIQSDAGDTLGEDYTLSFKTRNTAKDNNMSMLMMVGMMGAMFFFTSMESKRKAKKEAEEKGVELDDSINPYKIAKERNIPLKEAIAIAEKEKQKAAKKRARLEAEPEDADDDDEEFDYDNGNFRVSRKRPIAEAGGKTPRSIRRQKEEKRRLAEIERRERQLKSRGKKKKK